MKYVIKTEICNPRSKTFSFPAQKTMYGGKDIVQGDQIFLIASENEGGSGLMGWGVVTSSAPTAKKTGPARQTPRVSIKVVRKALVKKPLGRTQLKDFIQWNDSQPQTELNFKLYRQATNKIIAVSDQTAQFLEKFF